MRFTEFRPLYEDDFDQDGGIGDYVEDDADHEADNALIDTLREIQFSSSDKKIPKIAVGALINLVKNKPGGEAFDLNALEKARKNNEAVKEMIKNVEDNEEGVKYVFINPIEPLDSPEGEAGGGGDQAGMSAPEKTVSSMANRALSSRT
jgi:hypothetical protein